MSNSGIHVGLDCKEPVRNWFAVATVPRHEKRVEQHFRVREIESFLPLYQTKRQWKDGSKRTVQIPLFSTYIFVRIDTARRLAVLQVPGVISIIGGRGRAFPVPDSYIDTLREGLRLNKIEPYPFLVAGARVRVRSGMMAGLEGVLIRCKNNFRIVLSLAAIMKSVTVEVAMNEIEPVGRWPDYTCRRLGAAVTSCPST